MLVSHIFLLWVTRWSHKRAGVLLLVVEGGICMHPSNRRETGEAWAVLASSMKTLVLVWQRGEGGEITAAAWPLLMWQGGRRWCGGAGRGALSASVSPGSSVQVLRLTLAGRKNAFLLNSCSCGYVYTLYLILPIIISRF